MYTGYIYNTYLGKIMSWLYLFIAGLFEIGWAIGLKYCYELKLNLMTLSVVISMILSFVFLSLAIQKIPLGVAYAIWTSIGVIGVFLYSFFILKESIPIISILFISFIIIGVAGLKLVTKI
jgi:quaternary ammonium compound-resistance protein SugE